MLSILFGLDKGYKYDYLSVERIRGNSFQKNRDKFRKVKKFREGYTPTKKNSWI